MKDKIGGNMNLNRLITVVFSSLFIATGAQAVDLSAQSGEKVFFRGWQYRTDIVQSIIDRYNDDFLNEWEELVSSEIKSS